MTGRTGLALAAAAFVALAAPTSAAASSAADPVPWGKRKAAAVRFAESRAGVESFAFVDENGKLYGYRAARPAPSASLLKAMLLVAYVRRPSVRDRALTASDRALLAPMVIRSDNVTATRVLGIVGSTVLYRLARRANMLHFRLRSPWGLSEVTARDQARFFYRIDRFVPPRHRRYVLALLAQIVPSQRWGIAPVVPKGWRIHFKGGWASGTGRVTHQSALLRSGSTRLALSVLTEWNPSHAYGTWTIRGIARRFLRGPLPLPPE